MDAGLTIQVRHEPEYDVITVAGEIDVATVATLREPLNVLAESGRTVIADLDQVGFMDASGLGAIVGAYRRAVAHGASLHVVCDGRTRQLFQVTGLDRRVPLARTLDEALRSLPGGQPRSRPPATGLRLWRRVHGGARPRSADRAAGAGNRSTRTAATSKGL